MDSQQGQKPLLAEQTENPKIKALTEERDNLDDTFFNAKRLLTEAIQKEQSGKKNGVAGEKLLSVVPEVNAQIKCRVRIPTRDYPGYNFVGKLLGPKGSTLKQLQLDTGTRMSILGRGSMRDKNKEQELRTGTDPKFEHLNMDLHVLIEAAPCPPSEAYSRVGHALTEMKKFLTPEEGEEYGRQGPMLGDAPPGAQRGGRGRGRGAPPGRGMPRAMGGVAPAQRGRPAFPGSRGAPRGAVRGGRGAPPGRGRAAPRPLATYGQQEEYYEESGYGESYAETGYEDGTTEATTYGYAAETGAGDGYEYSSYGGASQTYGGQAQASAGGNYGGYGGSGGGTAWSSGGAAGGGRQQMKAPTQYTQKPAQRAHPYARY